MDSEDEREFRQFVAARQTALLRTAFLLTGSWHSGEDLLQTALTKTYLAWPRIKDKALAERYVRTTMSRTAVSWWRRRWTSEEATADLPDVAVEDPSFDTREELWRALKTLPVRQRAVLVLRFYEDLTEADIADVLGCSTGSVKSHASRGLKALRARLGDNLNGDPMTIEDSLRDVLAAKVVEPPEVPGLYGKVTARAVVVRRRRRVAAAVGSCAAVVAIAVPLAFTVGGSSPRPGGPTVSPGPHTTAHALPVPTTTPAAQPSISVTAAPTSSLASPTGPAYITNSAGLLVESPPPPPAAPTLSLPRGGAYTAPVVLVDGRQLSLQDKGSTYALGRYGTDYEYPVATKFGVLLPGAHSVDLIGSEHRLVELPGSTGANGCGGVLVSRDGRYAAWGTQGGPGGSVGTAPSLKGTYLLFDLQARKVAHRYSAQAQGCPQAFATDGRVLMSLGDGAAGGLALWDPASGTTSSVPPALALTLWTTASHAETVNVRLDENGFCSYYRPGLTGGKAYLGACGSKLGGPTQDQERLSSALARDHLALSDEAALDATHVGVIASAQRKAEGGDFTFTYSWLLTCTVPAHGAVSCVQNQQLAPVRTANSGPDEDLQVGPKAFLVR